MKIDAPKTDEMIDYIGCGKRLQGCKATIICTLPKGHEGMCGLADYSGFRWIDRCMSDAELNELSRGDLDPDKVIPYESTDETR